jgi:hypothetical protein
MLRPAAAAVAVAALAAGFASGSSNGTVVTGTVACSTRIFEVSFDPARRVVVTSGGKVLAAASFTALRLGGSCRRIADPKGFGDGGLGPELRTATGFRCAAPDTIRIHVSPIRDKAGKIVGNKLSVGTGGPQLRVIVSAVLRSGTSRIYRARSACKLGAAR